MSENYIFERGLVFKCHKWHPMTCRALCTRLWREEFLEARDNAMCAVGVNPKP